MYIVPKEMAWTQVSLDEARDVGTSNENDRKRRKLEDGWLYVIVFLKLCSQEKMWLQRMHEPSNGANLCYSPYSQSDLKSVLMAR